MVGEPREPLDLCLEPDHAEVEALAVRASRWTSTSLVLLASPSTSATSSTTRFGGCRCRRAQEYWLAGT